MRQEGCGDSNTDKCCRDEEGGGGGACEREEVGGWERGKYVEENARRGFLTLPMKPSR